MNPRKMIRALVLAALASVLVYASLIVVSDGDEVAAALRAFPITTFCVMLFLGVACYVIRGLRWGALLRVAGHRVRLLDALYLHFAGQTMSISPGRLGEVLKPLLSREISGLPLSRGIALVFAERIADLLAVCLLSLGGLSLLGGDIVWLVAGIAVILAGTALASSEWFHLRALRLLRKRTWTGRYSDSAAGVSEAIRASLAPRVLAWSVAASVAAWACEGVGFALCLGALGFAGLDLQTATSVYAVSTIVGALTFLPGGIGLTEASMAGILVAAGMPAAGASAATLLTRVATLWWAVALGWPVLLSRPKLFANLLSTPGESRPT